MARAAEVGGYFKARLQELQKAMPGRIKEVRGRGLMVGLQLSTPDAKLVHKYLMESGIVANATSDSVLRFVPPLVVTKEDCDRVVTTIEQALNAL